jgi:hypothetical protein
MARKERHTRVVRTIILKQTNMAIPGHVADISREFSTKQAADRQLMAVERKVAR